MCKSKQTHSKTTAGCVSFELPVTVPGAATVLSAVSVADLQTQSDFDIGSFREFHLFLRIL